MRTHAIDLFRATFHDPPTAAASAPGRVNLIGEHTDYNGGPVLPMAIERRTAAAVGPGDTGWLDLVSSRDARRHRVRWDGDLPSDWPAYVVGVMRELAARNCAPRGARISVASDVPPGGGLSSSAALTVSTARALAALDGARLAPTELIEIAYHAEHDHVGVRCGIMDQTVVVRARAGHALLIECATGRTRQVPVRARFLLADSGVRHALGTSPYNTRRAECEAAREVLVRAQPDLQHLADWPPSRIGSLRRLLEQPLRSRALHVVTETARTREAATVLDRGRLRAFGRLMNASHESCRRNYECSVPELDLIVRAARRAGAWGARLTGAGWGGAVLILVGPERAAGGAVERRIVDGIRGAFLRAYGREPTIAPVRASPGVRTERVGKG